MTQSTKNSAIFVGLALGLAVALTGCCANAVAQDGEWKFARSSDYYGRTKSNEPPPFPLISVSSKEIQLSATCIAQFSPARYSFPRVFQPLSKEGVTEKQLDRFLLKAFGLALGNIKTVYSIVSSPNDCADPVMEFFQFGDSLIIPDGNTFYSYTRGTGAKPKVLAAMAPARKATGIYAAYKVTSLPMDFDRYFAWCRPKILGGKTIPQTTEGCAPEYFPYVADSKSTESLMKLIGNHDYEKGGSEYAAAFSPPFKQKTVATFLVFAPMKQVTLVRVDDFEVLRNEERDIMSGVYLSIVGGKVIDQISDCDFDLDYICKENGRPVAKLTENGKFQRL